MKLSKRIMVFSQHICSRNIFFVVAQNFLFSRIAVKEVLLKFFKTSFNHCSKFIITHTLVKFECVYKNRLGIFAFSIFFQIKLLNILKFTLSLKSAVNEYKVND